jgi:hypothetical protein
MSAWGWGLGWVATAGLLASTWVAAAALHPDHGEFEAYLQAPFQTAKPDGARDFGLRFSFPDAPKGTLAIWTLELLADDAKPLRSWQGATALKGDSASVDLRWDGRDSQARGLRPGYYTARLSAMPATNTNARLAAQDEELIVQSWDIQVGSVAKAQMPAFAPLPIGMLEDAAAKARPASGFPYTIYFGNLHAQTNHSDGGANVSTCSSSENPQAGQVDPAGAYAIMRSRGDFLLASEHNHMYDRSTGTNASADATWGRNLFNTGKSQASAFSAANPGFVAMYGTEWGTISNGGHLNIINPDGLANWEYGAGNQLVGHFFVPKNDYAALYDLMRSRGWIGQFNHPSSSQFNIGGVSMAFDADGAEVMVLAEVINTSAFSKNTSETETARSNYASAWGSLLRKGYKVAPATNQDNHCANYGQSYRNRTGILIPTGTAFTEAAIIDALRARRVFATEDKNAQLILTANGQMMGSSLNNSGSLTLVANYASVNGQSAQRIQFYKGSIGGSSVTQLAEGNGTYTFTPPNGSNFYYALVTQSNGDRLYSAPVWVEQGSAPSDTTPPTVSASVTGTSGTISLNATASDNVGVSNVEFRVDGVLRGSDSSAPYTLAFDSTTLSNGSHTLVARAVDAAGNSRDSTGVSFSVSNTSGGSLYSEAESNGSIASANAVSASYNQIRGTMGNSTDKDYFRLTVAAGERLAIGMTGPSGTDYDLYIVNGNDSNLAAGESGSSTESIAWTNSGSSSATVYAKVISYSGSSTTQYYTLTLTRTGGTGGGSAPSLFENSTDYSINDNATVDSPITVSGRSGNAPSTLQVSVTIYHSYRGDLKVDLVAPDGSLYNISNYAGGSADNLIGTYTINASSEAANGSWKLRVRDNYNGDTGRIDRWSLQF